MFQECFPSTMAPIQGTEFFLEQNVPIKTRICSWWVYIKLDKAIMCTCCTHNNKNSIKTSFQTLSDF